MLSSCRMKSRMTFGTESPFTIYRSGGGSVVSMISMYKMNESRRDFSYLYTRNVTTPRVGRVYGGTPAQTATIVSYIRRPVSRASRVQRSVFGRVYGSTLAHRAKVLPYHR